MSFICCHSLQYFWFPFYLFVKKFLHTHPLLLLSIPPLTSGGLIRLNSKVIFLFLELPKCYSIDQLINILSNCLGVCLPWDIFFPLCEKGDMTTSSLHPLVPGTEFNYSDCLMSAGWNHSHIQLGRHRMSAWDLEFSFNTWHTPAKCVITAYYARVRTVI